MKQVITNKINGISTLGKVILLSSEQDIYDYCDAMNIDWRGMFVGYIGGKSAQPNLGYVEKRLRLPLIVWDAFGIDGKIDPDSKSHQDIGVDGTWGKYEDMFRESVPYSAFINEDMEYFI